MPTPWFFRQLSELESKTVKAVVKISVPRDKDAQSRRGSTVGPRSHSVPSKSFLYIFSSLT